MNDTVVYAKFEVTLANGHGEPFHSLTKAKQFAEESGLRFINVFDTETGELADTWYTYTNKKWIKI